VKCIIIDLQVCNCTSYVGSVHYVVSLLSVSLSYFLITLLMFYNIIFMFVFCFVFLFSILCILFLYVLSIASRFVLSLSYFCIRRLTAATGWKPNFSK
jgi:hypothetical protein